MKHQAAGFIAVGLFAGAANILARIGLSTWFNYQIAVALAFPIALSIAYVANRQFVFDGDKQASVGEFSRFALVNIIALAQVWVISVGLARFVFPAIGFTWCADTVAHAIGVGSPILTSFFAYKLFVFRGAVNDRPR